MLVVPGERPLSPQVGTVAVKRQLVTREPMHAGEHWPEGFAREVAEGLGAKWGRERSQPQKVAEARRECPSSEDHEAVYPTTGPKVTALPEVCGVPT